MASRPTQTFGTFIAIFIGFFLLANGIMKLIADENSLFFINYSKLGLVSYLTVFGILEIIFLIIYLIRFTSPIGVLLISAQLGADIVVSMSSSDSYLIYILVLIGVWITAIMRTPEMFSGVRLPKITQNEDEDDY